MDRSPEERRRTEEYFQQVRSGLQTFYRWFLYLVVALVAGFAIYLYPKWRRDPNWSFLSLYFGILLIVFIVWVIAQLRSMGSKSSPGAPSSDDIPFSENVETNEETGARRITLRWGSGPQTGDRGTEPEKPDLTTNFGFKLTSLPPEARPDDAAVSKAGELLAQGMDLDAVCRQIQPGFLQWGSVMQRVYKVYLQGLLELANSQREGADRTAVTSTTSANAPVASSPPAASPEPSSSLPAGPMVQSPMDGVAKAESGKELPQAASWVVFILILTAVFIATLSAVLLYLKIKHP